MDCRLPNPCRCRWTRILTAAMVALVALAAFPADARAQDEAVWMEAVGAYRLSDEGLERFRQGIRSLVAVIEADPSVRERGAGVSGVEETVAFLEREPAVNQALTSAGMPPREYVLFSMAFMQAAMVAHMADVLGEDSLGELPPTVSQENVAYFRANRERLEGVADEIQAMMQRIEGDTPAPADAHGNDP